LRRLISMSSVPPRFSTLPESLARLQRDHGHLGAIRLYLPLHFRRFPGEPPSLPPLPDGVDVRRVAHDMGPATKLLAALDEHWRQVRDSAFDQILFCDDDKHYHPGWAAALFAEQAVRPDTAVCLAGTILRSGGRRCDCAWPDRTPVARPGRRLLSPSYQARRIAQHGARLLGAPRRSRPPHVRYRSAGYVDLLCGYGGAVIRPGFFDRDVLAISEACWPVDDVWISGQLARRGIGIWAPAGLRTPEAGEGDIVSPLRSALFTDLDRRALDLRGIKYFRSVFGVWNDRGADGVTAPRRHLRAKVGLL
jgi:hypothetical protein